MKLTSAFAVCTGLSLALFLAIPSCGGGGGGGGRGGSGGGGGTTVSVADVSVAEGNSGQTDVEFTVALSKAASGPVSVNYRTADGTATAGKDYVAEKGTLNFSTGVKQRTVTVSATADSKGENSETFTLTLSKPVGVTLGTAVATATLTNDDAPAKPAAAVGDAGIKTLQFSWQDAPAATSYRLLEDADGSSGFTQIGNDILPPDTSVNLGLSVFRTDWANARYRIEACNSFGCTQSASLAIDGVQTSIIGYVKAGNAEAGDQAGRAIALSGDGSTLAVGVPFEDSSATGVNGDAMDDSAMDSGAVFVFTRAGTTWVPQAYLKASNTDAADRFGAALALSTDGNVLAVGAPLEDGASKGVGGNDASDGEADAGAVYVFTRTGPNWMQSTYIKASNTQIMDRFGTSLALSLSGNVLIVGAPGEDSGDTGIGADQNDNSAADAGAAYIFTFNGVSWGQRAYVKASNAQAGDEFGQSVAVSGGGVVLAVGAPLEDSSATGVDGNQNNNAALDSGAVYVIRRMAATWVQEAYVKPSFTSAGSEFGRSVALSGDALTLAVGAPLEDSDAVDVDGDPTNANAPDSGAVFVFTGPGGTWSEQAYVKASNTGPGDEFGSAVALPGDGATLAVGAPLEDGDGLGAGAGSTENAGDSGAAYTFARSDTGVWSPLSYVKAPNTEAADGFARSVVLSRSGDALVVSAADEDSSATTIDGDLADNSASGSGAVYLY